MYVLGIDIAKEKFDVNLMNDRGNAKSLRRKEFSNTRPGFLQLLETLPDPQQTLVILEPTGVYSELAIECLDGKVAGVYQVNPQVIRRRGHSMVQTKTDPADAASTAQCGYEILTCHPEELEKFRVRFDPDRADLALLRQERDRLVAAMTRLKNQIQNLEHHTAPLRDKILKRRREELAELQRREKELDTWIDEKVTSLASEDAALIRSIPGIGPVTTTAFVLRIGDVNRFKDVDALKGYLGVFPRRRQSGKKELPARMARHGDPKLKFALWNAAKSASRFNPVCREYFERLVERGFPATKAWGAIMRKLVQIVYGVLKSRTPFDSTIGRKRAAMA